MIAAVSTNTSTIIIALVISIVAPSILAVGNSRLQRKSKQQDWDHAEQLEASRVVRENLVAEKAQEAADLLAKRTTEATDRAIATAEAAAAATAATGAQLAVIHGLVNSSLTEAWERELTAERSALAALQKFIALANEKSVPIPILDANAVPIKQARILQIEATLASREAQQQEIDRQIASSNEVAVAEAAPGMAEA